MQVCEKTRTHQGPKKESVTLGLFIHAFAYGLWEHHPGPSLLPGFLFTWPLQLQCLNASQVAERRNNVISVSLKPTDRSSLFGLLTHSFWDAHTHVPTHTWHLTWVAWWGHWVSLAGKPLVAFLSAQVQVLSVGAFRSGWSICVDPSAVEGWMMLVVTSSVGYTCGKQCRVVDVSYQNKSPLLCLRGMWWGGAVCGRFRVNFVGFGTCQIAHDAPCTVSLGLSFLLQHPHPCLPTPLWKW